MAGHAALRRLCLLLALLLHALLGDASLLLRQRRANEQVEAVAAAPRDEQDVRDCTVSPPFLPPTVTITQQRLLGLRQLMSNVSYNLDVYIIPASDSHMSEYIATRDARMAWITGFTGSSGIAVVAKTKAGLWTDSRYWIQAERQMDCNWQLHKGGTSDVVKWILELTTKGGRVGVDPFVLSINQWNSFNTPLSEAGRLLIPVDTNLVDVVWGAERPATSSTLIYYLPDKFTGSTWVQKVEKTRSLMREHSLKPTALILSALDECAWLFNLRCNDIPYNPFFFAYAFLTLNETRLYLDLHKVGDELHAIFNDTESPVGPLSLRDYGAVRSDLLTYGKGDVRVWAGEEFTTYGIYRLLPKEKLVMEQFSPVQLTKAVKNPHEREALKSSHIRDAVAVIQYMVWLEENVPKGTVTELSGQLHLDLLRGNQAFSEGPSFETISASGLNGALAHYSASNETNRKLTASEMYLFDSGGQYRDGTTDITRTLHWGVPTDFMKEAYTRVLMGSIDLSQAIFPDNTLGARLDTWARHALWEVGLNYGHGTGHGIGNFLSVHEWPVGIGTSYDIGLHEGMFTSIEPGYYQDNEFGIRLENIAMVVKADTVYTFGVKTYLTFETVTLVPYEKKLIKLSLLSDKQVEWLNRYNAAISREVGAELMKQNLRKEHEWLRRATEPFGGEAGRGAAAVGAVGASARLALLAALCTALLVPRALH
ncbi:xaa-Pro aminopeptidase 2 [Lampetra fluviatilis]